jgi:hypothetical protein
MRQGGGGRVYLLATMVALAALNTVVPRVLFAQIPEAPGTFTNSNGTRQQAPQSPKHRRTSTTPTPSDAAGTVREMRKARARASGTPLPTPTPHHLGPVGFIPSSSSYVG